MNNTLDINMKNELITKALEARKNSYSPYSGFGVGAALLGKSGKIYQGCNIESASYSPTNCAERTALFAAVAQGEREFTAVAVVGGKGYDNVPEDFAAPCGVCRQALYEFNNGDMVVIIAKSTEDYKELTLKELLPLAFTPASLV